MRRISICQFSTFRWSFFEDIIQYAGHGFDSVGIWRRKIDDFGQDAAIDLLYETKMSVSSLHWAGGFTGDGRSYEEAIEDATESIQLASRLQAGCLIIHPGSRNGHTASNATRLFHSALKRLLPIAADYGVRLAIEPILDCRRSPWTFLESFDDSLKLLDRHSDTDLSLVLDLFHVGYNSVVYEQIDSIVNRIALVQLADAQHSLPSYPESNEQSAEPCRLLLGHGNLPMENWLSKLQQLGYAGRFELEVHGSAIEGMDYSELLNETHDFLSANTISNLTEAIPKRAPMPRYQLGTRD